MNRLPMGPESEPEPTLLAIVAVLLRWRRWTLGLPIGLAIATAVVVLLLPRNYTASASFVPQRSQSQLGRLAGLAAQFGVAVPGQNAAESSEFYGDLAGSREILARIVDDTFRVSADRPAVPLGVLLEARGDTPEALSQDAVRRLGRAVETGIDQKTGVVSVRIRSRWPDVSRRVAEEIISAITSFDLHTRQSAAAVERAFIEGRLADAKAELRGAEDQLEQFSIRNRDYRNSPPLQLQYDRLSRTVSMNQQTVTTLQQDYEQARIDEVRNTPRITVVEHAVTPARPDSRRGLLRVLLALLLGVMLSWPTALLAEHVRKRDGEGQGDWDEVRGQIGAVLPKRWRPRLGG